MFKGLTINQRFLGLISLWVIILYCYQLYYHYNIDRVLENNNKSVRIYTKMLNEADSDNSKINEQLWKVAQARDYWRGKYYASEVINDQLETEIDTVSEYWKDQFIKVSDELFDLKNTKDPKK